MLCGAGVRGFPKRDGCCAMQRKQRFKALGRSLIAAYKRDHHGRRHSRRILTHGESSNTFFAIGLDRAGGMAIFDELAFDKIAPASGVRETLVAGSRWPEGKVGLLLDTPVRCALLCAANWMVEVPETGRNTAPVLHSAELGFKSRSDGLLRTAAQYGVTCCNKLLPRPAQRTFNGLLMDGRKVRFCRKLYGRICKGGTSSHRQAARPKDRARGAPLVFASNAYIDWVSQRKRVTYPWGERQDLHPIHRPP